jgi:hypothetical protein
MACACGKAKNRKIYTVKLPGGLKITKTTEAAALAFAAKHPGSTVIKPA